MRATVIRQISTILCGTLFSVNVDYTSGSETELSGGVYR